MQWIHLTGEDQLKEIITNSQKTPQVIFKHSTRCSVSSMVMSRLQKAGVLPGADFYYLDLIANRTLSNKIAETFHVHHESPQILVIKNGECVYDESHMSITVQELEEQIS
jgi:bacillithiol system protein YtxJ